MIDKLLIISLSALGSISLLFVSDHFQHIDFGIYYLYTKSLFNDFDFNLANQIVVENNHYLDRFVVTQSKFDANYHPFGLSVFYAPFYLVGELGSYFLKTDFTERFMGLGTIFYSLSTFAVLYKTYSIKFSSRTVLIALLVAFFSTPWFFYTAIESGNSNIIALFLSSLFFAQLAGGTRNYFFVGSILSIMFLTKVETIFYIIPVLGLLIKKPYDLKKVIIPVLGIFSIFLFLWGRYLRFGELFLDYGGITYDYFVLKDILFTPVHGYLFTSPIYIFVITFILFNLSLLQNKFFIYFVMIFILKVFLEAFTMNSGVNMGARSHLIDMPLLVYCLASMINRIKSSKLLIFAFFPLWTTVSVCAYIAGFRLFSMESFFVDYLMSLETYKVLLSLVRFDGMMTVIGLGVSVVGFCLLIIFKRYLLYGACCIYVLLVLNTSLSREYTLKKHNKMIVGNDVNIWFLREETSNFIERLDLLLYRNDIEEFRIVLSLFEEYLRNAELEIIEGDIDSYWKLYNHYASLSERYKIPK